MKKDKLQSIMIPVIRIIIGWHFLYEGLSKLLEQDWSSKAFLIYSNGFLASFFRFLANSDAILKIVDILNIWGLILIGLALVLGIFSRFAAISGILLLSLYYLANPPAIIVNILLIEILALSILLIIRPKEEFGIGVIVDHMIRNNQARIKEQPSQENISPSLERRDILRNLAVLPVLGIFSFAFSKSKNAIDVDSNTGASYTFGLKKENQKDIEALKGLLPTGNLESKTISRLILGGNLLAGAGHQHQLKYLRNLGKAYNTKERVYEAIYFAEQLGINSLLIDGTQLKFVTEYKKLLGGKIQSFVSCPDYALEVDNKMAVKNMDRILKESPMKYVDAIKESIDRNIDNGADILFLQGIHTDKLAAENKPELLDTIINHAQDRGYLFGIGGHTLYGAKLCENNQLNPDFYFKTLHHDRYPSATPKEFRDIEGYDIRYKNFEETPHVFSDNMWCRDADEVVEYMRNVKKPWIAYKVLAAGAIPPQNGIKYAFESGSDFIALGMYDFQIAENVKLTTSILGDIDQRRREWYA